MWYSGYDQFIYQQSQTLKQELSFFDDAQKIGKKYNDMLIGFLSWSVLTLTPHCHLDINKKNAVLVDLLSDLPIIDQELFDFLFGLRGPLVDTKPLGGNHHDYEQWTDMVKHKIKDHIKVFVKQRADAFFVKRQHEYTSMLWDMARRLNVMDFDIQTQESYLATHGFADVVEHSNEEDVQLLNKTREDNVAEQSYLLFEYDEYGREYSLRVQSYGHKVALFEKKIQLLAEKYIFAHTNPLARLKKTYIELFLLDSVQVDIVHGPDYAFELWSQVVKQIDLKKKELVWVLNDVVGQTALDFE